MITLQELYTYLDQLLQPIPMTDYCVNGIQVEGASKITKLATAVSANLETIRAATAWGAQALIVHHGLFWNRDSHEIRGVKREKLALLFSHDISLLAYHLPLDAHRAVGNNWKAAIDLGWTDLEPFCGDKGVFLGVKGRFPAISREEFQEKIEAYYQHPAHAALGGKEVVESAGIVSGGSYRFISDAIAENLDCFIAGNFDEPAWSQAHEEKINFYAMGHSATERIGPMALCEELKKQFPIECKFIDVYNPF
jgi:dinuclear metal center YbgI/SA1388 family protein